MDELIGAILEALIQLLFHRSKGEGNQRAPISVQLPSVPPALKQRADVRRRPLGSDVRTIPVSASMSSPLPAMSNASVAAELDAPLLESTTGNASKVYALKLQLTSTTLQKQFILTELLGPPAGLRRDRTTAAMNAGLSR